MAALNYLLIFGGGILFGVIIIYFLNRRGESFLMLQKELQHVSRQLDEKLGESGKMMQSHFFESSKNTREVIEHVVRLDEIGRQVVSFADQLARLQDILKNPKQRGVLGEYYLDALLSKSFQPNQYQMQYRFRDGEIVDAALFFGDKIIPIDSKFSLENYNRILEEKNPTEREHFEKIFKQDLKNRIDETAKYIRPEEGTTEFAFMFIPAEGIFYDLLVNKVGIANISDRNLLEYAVHEKRVHIVSPTTFYATLQSMIVGMRAYAIQESTKQIIKNVSVLTQHLRVYADYFRKIGGNLSTTVNSYMTAQKEFGKIDKDVTKISGKSIELEPVTLDKPSIDE